MFRLLVVVVVRIRVVWFFVLYGLSFWGLPFLSRLTLFFWVWAVVVVFVVVVFVGTFPVPSFYCFFTGFLFRGLSFLGSSFLLLCFQSLFVVGVV